MVIVKLREGLALYASSLYSVEELPVWSHTNLSLLRMKGLSCRGSCSTSQKGKPEKDRWGTVFLRAVTPI
jgi:hypothetical protein